MDIVNEVLKKSTQEKGLFKTTDVVKHLEIEYDLGSLLASDSNEINLRTLRANKENFLRELARDNTQLLINKIWDLPTERVEEAVVAKLPEPSYILPRKDRIPKPKPLTKWEKFAKEKGLKKTKKAKLQWDDVLQKWVPTYGYRRSAAEKEHDWLLEVPQNADPMEDQFSKKTNSKVERVAKNEFQRLRNLAVSKNIKVPQTGIPSADKLDTKELSTAVSLAKVSTASVGKFQSKLPKEKGGKIVDSLIQGNRKRKLPPPRSDQEKKNNLAILDGILKKQPRLDIEKAVNREIFNEQQQRFQEKLNNKPKKNNSKKRAGASAKKGRGSGKRPPAKNGKKYNRIKEGGGRKRR